MKKQFETPFNDAFKKKINDVPDHILENINHLTSKILQAALWDKENEARIDTNLSLASMQKALSLLIAQFFPKEKVPEIADRIALAIKVTATELANVDLSREQT
jgi:hypothetical protein